jgi:Protein of unknown function (DUF1194)
MRLRLSLIASLAVMLAAALAGLGFAASPLLRADNRPNATRVDVELVLAVDVSYSMDPEEQALQREGYIAALTSREFMQALKQGMNAKVAVTYFEWAGAADAVAAEIQRAPYRRASRTSISGALQFSLPLFQSSGYRGIRQVIDVSGDGVNNNGLPVTIVRDEVLSKGITINGLPIMLKRPNVGSIDIEELDVYYEDCVIGGPGAFVIAIREREKFKEAIRTKLVLEIAGRTPERRVIPVAADKPRISCTVGERMWQQRWGN